jgi:hypothetical protein
MSRLGVGKVTSKIARSAASRIYCEWSTTLRRRNISSPLRWSEMLTVMGQLAVQEKEVELRWTRQMGAAVPK